ncbi:MAG TPA: hypothetical protein DEP65_13680, partial [Ruminococcus sp.]|nr:hypothetical protein [Ruminococcus sp.]
RPAAALTAGESEDVMKKYIIYSGTNVESWSSNLLENYTKEELFESFVKEESYMTDRIVLETFEEEKAIAELKKHICEVDCSATSAGYEVRYSIVELAESDGEFDEDGNWEENRYCFLAYASLN